MRSALVYDLPTRLFHWFFVFLFASAFLIAKTIDDESLWFSFHMLLGLTLGFVVVLRLIWGLVGSRYALLSSFQLKPTSLIEYFKNVLARKKESYLGHNPASSWAGVGMIAFALAVTTSGLLMVLNVGKEFFEELHELFAYGILALVVGHIAGIALHTIRYKDMIGLSMIDGKKEAVNSNEQIEKHYFGSGIIFLILVSAFMLNLYQNFNKDTKSLNLFGNTLSFAKEEGEIGSDENDKD